MSEGIKETKEVLVGSICVGKLIVSKLKNGFQKEDLLEAVAQIMGDEVTKTKLQAAVADAGKSVAEIKDISFAEGAELLGAALSELRA